ncbi:hypothetical protein FOZ63_004929, partial [Perkinsus olseni]
MPPRVAPTQDGDGLIHSTGMTIADVLKLPVCVDPLWSGPRSDMPYPMFKKLVQQQQAVYELRGSASYQYLMRCLGQPLRGEIQEIYLRGVPEETVWEGLDARYDAPWRTYGMHRRWKQLEQGQGETVHEFANRVTSMASVIYTSTGIKPSSTEQAGTFRDGLQPEIAGKLDSYLGPRFACLEEAKDVAEYYESKLQKGKAHSKGAGKVDNKSKPQKWSEVCRHFLRGTCSFGDRCRFSHTVGSSPQQVKPTSSTGSSTQNGRPSGICHQFFQTGTCNRDRCLFRHERPSAPTAPKPTPTTKSSTEPAMVVIDDNDQYPSQEESWALVMAVQSKEPTTSPTPQSSKSLTALLKYKNDENGETHNLITLLDTGCTINLLSLEAAEKMRLKIEPLSCKRDVTLADGSSMPLAGGTMCVVSTAKASAFVKFWVVDQLAFSSVLGLDALGKLCITIELKPDSLPVVSSGNRNPKSSSSGSSYEDPPVFSCGVLLEPFQGHSEVDESSTTFDDNNDVSGLFPDESNAEAASKCEPFAPVVEYDDHFEVGIPWRDTSRPRFNLAEAKGRFQSLLRHTSSSDIDAIQNELNEMLHMGRIRECKPSDISYYLPLRPVYKPSSSTHPVRLTVDGRKLNVYTHKCSTAGKLKITDVLIVMRSSAHFTTLDLQRAFNCIGLCPSSQCWYGLYMFEGHYVWLCLPFGCNYSSAALFRSLSLRNPFFEGSLSFPITIFVDDIGVRGDTIVDLHRNEKIVVEGFEKKNFVFQSLKRVSTDGSFTGEAPYLGYTWDVDNDRLCQVLPPLDFQDPITKRSLISSLSVWYDVAGLFIAVGVSARLLAADIHSQLAEWDTPATEELTQKVRQWYADVRSREFSTPRALNLSTLYIFCDSSNAAWCSQVNCPLISTDVGPLYVLRSVAGVFGPNCRWSIPKKELYGLWRSVRLCQDVVKYVDKFKIPVSSIIFYTDSAITLWRLKRPKLDADLSRLEKKWARDIRSVCSKLCDGGLVGKVVHVRSASNLADAATRAKIDSTTTVLAEEARKWASGSGLVIYDPAALIPSSAKSVDEPSGLQCMATMANAVQDDELSTPVLAPSQTDQVIDWGQLARQNQEGSPFLSALRDFLLHEQVPDGCSIPRRVLSEASKFHTVKDGLLYRCVRTTSEGQLLSQVVLDPKVDAEAIINRLIDHYHNSTTHLGAEAVARDIKAEYYWPGINSSVRKRLRSCDPCQRVHASVAWRKTVGSLRMKSTTPGQVIGLDHVVNLPTSDGNFRHVLSLVCAATGFVWFRATKTTRSIETTKLLDSIFSDASYPICLVVDGGFNSTLFREWCATRHIMVATLPPHHRGYGGWLERCHLHLRQYIATKHASGEDVKQWPTWLGDLQLVHNLTVFPGLDFGPADLFYGRRL